MRGALAVTGAALAAWSAAHASVLPGGRYRAALDTAGLRAAGASSREATEDAGGWTLLLAGGRWRLSQSGGALGDAVLAGTVARAAAGAAFTLTSADGYAHVEEAGTFRTRTGRDGSLVFVPTVRPRNGDVAAILSARPWRRVR